MKIKFCGAARTVTGSQHLLEISGKKILLDCGLYQGKREEAFKINRHFPFDPASIHSVVLSHAHMDHSGNLPTLYSKGFKGDIYTTTASRDLCAVMLQDSAHIQERDVDFVNKKRAKKNEPAFNPLYGFNEVREVMKLFKAVSYGKKFFIDGFNQNVSVAYCDAGHILGSGSVVLEINENGKNIKLGFTGDLGRFDLPLLKDPEFMGDVNYVISESTYGGRVHDKAVEMERQFETSMKEAIARGGKIIVPAFSLGRTQEVIYTLSKLFNRQAVPRIPIFVDSPLSTNISDIFKIHHECFDAQTSELISKGVDVFGFSNLTYIKSVDESKALNRFKGPCMIISASGMCEAGRVLHHLANNIEDPQSTVLIIGFMAPDTLGRRLVEAKDMENAFVKIYGEEHKVNAKIVILNSFSAHADKDELTRYFQQYDKNMLEQVFLVHGDYDQQQAFKGTLNENGFKNVSIPAKLDEVEI